jgi:stage II sporulation protein D
VSGNNVKEVFNIEEKELIILASPDNNENLTGYSLISDIGAYSYEGIEASYYIDKKIQVLLKNNEIIAVVGVIDENPVIENCFIVQNTGQEITIFSGGVERTYLFNNSGGDLANKICDLRIHEDGAEITNLYEEAITGKILKVTGAVAEFEGVGTKKLAQRAKVYSTADGDVTWKGPSSLIVGSDIAYYFMNGDEIRAAVIIKNQIPENIRVAISNTGYTSLYHDTVEITSEEGFSAFLGGDESYYGPGEIYSPVLDNGGRVFIKPSVGGKIIINSIRRNWPGGAAPAYRGTVEVSKEGGKYVIVNEAPFEEYLYAVIPSEMPTSFGLEAAKVQAVTARSYAHNQFLENKYHEYGANIDDSVNSQVYNNIPENESSVIAVDETNGVFITHQGKVVSANFFSTSAGYTANSGEIWADATTKQFPGDTPPYLTAAGQFEGAGFGDLSIEENAIKFFKDPDVECFEKGAPWFRWNVEMTAEEISNSVNSNLAARYKANPSLIKTLQEDGYYRTKGIESVGKITNMQVIKRGEAGNIMQLKLSGTEASIMVYTEYNIRMLLKPSSPGKEITLNLDGGDIVENYSLMPSSFFVFDKYVDADGNLTRVVFYGGGNGHGVGMSQTGVRALIGLGYDFESIIKHYFAGVELSAISG